MRTDLITNIATPLQFFLESDRKAETFLVNLADSSVATVTMDGDITVVDAAAQSFQGSIGWQGRVAYAVLGPPRELRLAEDGESPETLSNPFRFFYTGTYNRSGYSKPRTLSSDGRLALFATTRDPATGLTDLNLLDLKAGAVIPLETDLVATTYSEIFTSDGDHALYFTNPIGATATLVTAGRTGETRTIGPVDGVWDVLAAAGDDVSFNTDPILDFSSFRATFLWTGDLYVVDVDHPHATPRLVAEQASLIYLPSHDRKELVFPSESEPAGPGLYLASARP